MEVYEMPLKLNSVFALVHIEFMAASSSDPLFSFFITFYTLILIFFPCALKIFLSPVLILTAFLLLFLLRLGACQRPQSPKTEQNEIEINEKKIVKNRENSFDSKGNSCSLAHVDKWVQSVFYSKPYFEGSFVEWNVKAPLEVIYEAYEGEEEEEDPNENNPSYNSTRKSPSESHPSLSMYYPDTDSDYSTDNGFPVTGEWESPERVCFQLEEEDKEGLIEIALDRPDNHSGSGFLFEEENLIEIDISPSRKKIFSGEV